ncbi:MAG: oligosaccharide flippase family protein [Fibrobacter sp.]|nr:oligosaccharide flippase family protein [Fibrobacter sp.]
MESPQGSRLIKNSVFLLFNTFFMMSTSWVISIWITRQLGPSNYGIFNMVLWVSGTVCWVIAMGLTHATTRFIAEYNNDGKREYLRPILFYIIKIELVITLISTAILIFFRTKISTFFFSPNESFYFFLAAIGLLPGIITAILSSAIEGIQKFEYFTYSNLIIAPLSFIGKISVLLLGYGVTGLLTVVVAFSFVNMGFYYWVLSKEGLLKKNDTKLTTSIKEKIQNYNKSIMAILICDKIVWDKSENFFLGRYCDSVQIGYYNLGYNIAQRLTSILPTTFWKVLFPVMSSFNGTGSENKMRRLFYLSTRYIAFFSFPVGAAGIILSFHIVKYLYGIEYLGSQRVLQVILAASVFSNLSGPASAVLYGFDKQAFIYKYGAVLAVINVCMDFFAIRAYGAIGAAICYGIITVIASVGGLIYTCRTMKLKYPIVSIFKILFSTALMSVVMKMVLMFVAGIPGLIFSFSMGIFVYVVSSLVLGDFEDEDFYILEHAKYAFPGKTKIIVDYAHTFFSQFRKSGLPGNSNLHS